MPLLAQTPPPGDENLTQLTLAEYEQLLATSLEQLIPKLGQNERDAGDLEQTLATLQAEIARVETVRLPTGKTITVVPLLGTPTDATEDTSPTELTAKTARERLSIALDQIERSSNDNTEARLATLEQVFARPEFSGSASLIERLRAWLIRLLDALLPDPVPGGQGTKWFGTASSWVAWAVVGVGALLLAILLSYWLQKLLGNFIADAEARRRSAGDDQEFATSGEVRALALVSAQSGNYRLAVRQLYLSALLTLEERDLVSYDRSLTNHEVLDRVHPDHPVHTHLRPVVDVFDRVWYGIREPDHELFADYQQEIEQLQSLADHPRTGSITDKSTARGSSS